MPPQIDFRSIRDHAGTKARGFEELCYQLVPFIEGLASDVRLVRHGNPDGGIEFRAVFASGEVWAWQAKFLFDLRQSEFAQLDQSVKRALDSEPSITRYTFCLPYNRPAGVTSGRKSAMQRWDEHCEKWRGWANERGMCVEFHYVGESELLRALTHSSQCGCARYWFDTTILTQEWFEAVIERAVDDAGERYTPHLNVQLPIASVFDGLGRTKEFEKRVRLALRAVRDARRWHMARDKDLLPEEPSFQEKLSECEASLDDLDAATLALDFTNSQEVDFDGLKGLCRQARDHIEDAVELIWDVQRRHREEDPERRPSAKVDSAAWELRRTSSEVQEMMELLSSDAANLVNIPVLLVTGAPGTGKTHLLCDVARARRANGHPTVLIHGRRLVYREPWAQILEQLHVSCGVDEFLGALDVAAEVSNSRALILIDALNEGEGISLWPDYLNDFVDMVRRFPRLGVAMTCRTSYKRAVLPISMDESKFVSVEHHGFAGREYEAVKLFFSEYKLVMPDFPLLIPEFQNPQFLKLMCKGLSGSGQSTFPRGSTGVTWLYRTFLASVDNRLSQSDRCDYQAGQALAWEAASRIAAQMLTLKREWLTLEEARQLCDSLLNRDWSKSLLAGLLDEGVLMKELLSSHHDNEEIVLFSYQRMCDYLRAKALLDSTENARGLKPALTGLTASMGKAYRNSGLLEALSVLIPETYSAELHELIPDAASSGAIPEAFLESLIWRDLTAFRGPLPLDYLNKISRSSGDRALRALLQIACVPGHPFNAERLHKSLWRLSMPNRDASWSCFIHSQTDEEESPVARMVDWAWSEDTSHCADDAALLCATTLAWLLTSSNRFLRDRATKALVALLGSRPGVLTELLQRFHGVNDPYVAERLYAVAYGCCLISRDTSTISRVAELVYAQVFADGSPPVHILLRDYARGVIERALQLGCSLPDIDLTRVRPPYRSPWPITAPSLARLAQRYQYPSTFEYASIWSSVSNWMGDFHHYVMQHSLEEFLAPGQTRLMASARAAARKRASEAREALKDDLSPEQIQAVEKGDDPGLFSLLVSSESKELVTLYHESRLAKEPRHISFDLQLASRFILSKVISLGWTPARFADFDRRVNDFRASRTGHKSERIGKKYQWIALHELLARVADHCGFRPHWGQEDGAKYDGPWQIGRRDIDPSLLLRRSRAVDPSNTQCWWAPAAIDMPVRPTPVERENWLHRTSDLANPQKLIDLTNPKGARWMVLEGYYDWEEETPPEDDRYRVQRCDSWYQIRAYLVNQTRLPAFKQWAQGQNWMGRWMPESADFYGILGEYPWHPSIGELDPDRGMRDDVPVPVVVPAARYVAGSGGFDCSMDETVSGFVPSPYLVSALDLSWRGHSFEYEDEEGHLVTLDPTAEDAGPPVLLMDRNALVRLLDERQLAIVWTVLGEKRIMGSLFSEPRRDRLEVYGAFSFEEEDVRQISFDALYLDDD